MGPGQDQTLDPWICSQTRICSQTHICTWPGMTVWWFCHEAAHLTAHTGKVCVRKIVPYHTAMCGCTCVRAYFKMATYQMVPISVLWWRVVIFDTHLDLGSPAIKLPNSPRIYPPTFTMFSWQAGACNAWNRERSVQNWLRGYETFFMLSSTEHEIYPAHKNYNTEKYQDFNAKNNQRLYLSR